MTTNSVSNYFRNLVTKKSEYTGEYYTIEIDPTRNANLGEMGAIILKENKYMLPEETCPQEAFARAAIAYASSQEHAQRIYDYASQNWFMFASPVLSNAGNPRGLPISCYLIDVEDSRQGLADSWKEMLFLSTNGGGVGMNMSEIRSVGTGTSRGTSTPGMMAFLKVVDSLTAASKQGEVRRGATAVYMDVSHPEIVEFINCRKVTGGDINRKCTNIHNAVNIPDAFMHAVIADEDWTLTDPHTKKEVSKIKARELWSEILRLRMETGEPFIHFIDASNRSLPQPLKDRGLKIKSSNLCVAPDTLILTKQGYFPIKGFKDENVTIWNGKEWSEVTVRRTSPDGQKVDLIEIRCDDGSVINCTRGHKFYIKHGKKHIEIAASDLKPGMKLENMDLPMDVKFSDKEFPDAYSHGFYCGDGNDNSTHSWVYAPKYSVIPSFTKGSVDTNPSNPRRKWTHGTFDYPKYSVPTSKFSMISCLDWLAGYLDADACVLNHKNAQGLQMVSINGRFLNNIRLLLQSMGVHASLKEHRKPGRKIIKGTEYATKSIHRLTVTAKGVKRLLELGLSCRRLALLPADKQNPAHEVVTPVSILSVKATGRKDETFCFTEPKRHKGVFNGILTGQCSEILLPTAPGYTAVCCLSSINAEYFDKWKQVPTFIPDLVEMLDNVLSMFIKKAPPEMANAIFSAQKERSIGLGLMGFHSFLQKHNIPFESATASAFNHLLFNMIKTAADTHSEYLAGTRGEPEYLTGTGKRFAHIMAIAPNATSSDICGNTSPSIEPITANIYSKDTARGSFIIRNKFLQKVLEVDYPEQNIEEVWDSIIANDGSVQHLTFMKQVHKDVFKTARELDQMWIIEHAANRQKYIDQGQSVNLFFSKEVPFQYLHAVHKAAWEKGLKTLYYAYSKNMAKGVNTSFMAIDVNSDLDPANNKTCLSCEG